ncbi:MAG: hypothetical protein L6R42_006269 [Xanthoria sp. 1 TBL-2021]|nr:MAG: hypothetical protein L6R42_006269 [Xanthoria sp. 1 TBL-2021]
MGWLGDKVPSRQTPFLVGLIALGLSTFAIALTRDLVILLIARILSGLSSAVVSTVGYAILFDVVSTEKIGRALGFVSLSQSGGLLVGPALGGVLYEYGGYFNTFVPAFMLIATEIALRVLVVVKKMKRDKPITKDDAQEPSEVSILAKGYTANPLYGTTLPPQTDPSHTDLGNNPNNPTITSSDQICSTTPQSPPALQTSSSTTKTIHLLLTSPRILTALIALFLLNTILTAYDATIPIHIRTIFSLPATHASLLFLIMVSPFTLSPIAGYIVDRHGPHLPATLGLLILTPPVFLLQFIDSHSFPPPSLAAISPFAALGICLFTIGLGTAFCQPALMAEVSLVIENIEERQPGCFGPKGVVAFGFGVMNFAFAGGFLAGPVLAGALVEWVGWRGMNVVLGACGCGCVIGVGVVTGGGFWRWRGRGGAE